MASTAATTDAMALLPVRADDEEFTLETREVSPAHFLTKIERFSMLSKHGISQLESMEFEAGDYKWKVIIYPDGDESGKKVNHISVHLSMVGSLGITSLPASWEVYAIFNFFLYNHISHNYFCFRGKTQRFHAINWECGISKLMSKKRFREAANGILLNDECVFGAEVFVIKKQRVIENVCVPIPLTDPYKREWEIPNFSKLGKVWRSEEFSTGGYKWKQVIHPNGIPKVEGRFLSIFVQCVDSKSFGAHKKVRATYLFIFINMLKNKKNYSKEVSHWFSCWKPDWGYQEFMGVGDVGDPRKGFVVKDTLQLEIQLSVQVSQEPLKLE